MIDVLILQYCAMEKYAELKAPTTDAPDGGEGSPVMVSTTPTVPLLWPALFAYDECQIRRDGTLEVFFAGTAMADAGQRARRLCQAIPADLPLLSEAARSLARALRGHPRERVELFPVKLFSELQRDQQPVFLQRLVNLCDLWGRLRAGEPWDAVYQQLTWVDPVVEGLLGTTEQGAAMAGFVGQQPGTTADPSDVIVCQGQGEDDLDPEALVAGDRGLLLGCFSGRWKLMSTGSDQHLKGVRGSQDGSAFVVGCNGTALRLKQGRCSPMKVPSGRDLHAVWGSSSGSVVAVGDGGTVVVCTGRRWQSWSVPTEVDLRAVAGTGPQDIYVAGQQVLMIYDGVNWSSMTMPEQSEIIQLCNVNGVIHGAANSRWGGEVFSLENKVIKQDKQLPAAKRLAGIWRGWGAGMGVLAPPAQVLLCEASWTTEAVPADELYAVAAGTRLLALGRVGDYSVILSRSEDGWQTEASVPRQLRLNAAWVAGNPKPPRLGRGE